MSAHQPQAEARRKLLAAARRARPAFARPAFARSGDLLPRAIFLTDPARTPDPVGVAANLPRGFGVIYRHFGAADRLETARALIHVCRARGLILLIAADPDLALRVGAHGVHWPLARLSRVRPHRPGWIETASAHSRQDIARANRLGVHAVLFSAVFASASPSAGAPLGALRFRRLVHSAGLPVYALGGITAATAARAITGRAAGWAAIDAVRNAWGDAG